MEEKLSHNHAALPVLVSVSVWLTVVPGAPLNIAVEGDRSAW
jgi:hypothetical protein